MNKKEIKSLIPALIELLHSYPILENKYENIKEAMAKEHLEKVFWHQKCRFYAPNRMEEH